MGENQPEEPRYAVPLVGDDAKSPSGDQNAEPTVDIEGHDLANDEALESAKLDVETDAGTSVDQDAVPAPRRRSGRARVPRGSDSSMSSVGTAVAAPRRRSPGTPRSRYVDEIVRRGNDDVLVRIGERWRRVLSSGQEPPLFEQRANGDVFVVGQYRLVPARAPIVARVPAKDDGELPPEAIATPEAFLAQAKARSRILRITPHATRVLELNTAGLEAEEACLSVWIGDFEALIPMSLSGVVAANPIQQRARLDEFIGCPTSAMVLEVDRRNKLAILSRLAAMEALSRRPASVGDRTRMVVRAVLENRIHGELPEYGREALLYVEQWDGGRHEDLRQIPDLHSGISFEVEVLEAYPSYCVVSRSRVTGDIWAERVERKYTVGGTYLGEARERTASGNAWVVRFEPGIVANCVCSALDDWERLAPGVQVRVRLFRVHPETKFLSGRITHVQ